MAAAISSGDHLILRFVFNLLFCDGEKNCANKSSASIFVVSAACNLVFTFSQSRPFLAEGAVAPQFYQTTI